MIASLRVQARIIRALLVREIVSRYGNANLGFFWVIGEPLLLTSGVMVLWTISRQAHGTGVAVVPFALSGYTTIQLWRGSVFACVHAVRRSTVLTYHSNVKMLDILIAKCIVPSLGVFASFVFAYIPLALFNFIDLPRDPLTVIGAWLLTTWFCFSFSLVLGGLSELSEVLERLIHPIMYLTLPLTGAFYMVDWLPSSTQEIVLWSPLVNGVEMFRSGMFDESVITHWNAWYLASCCVGLTAIGIPLVSYVSKKVESL